MNDNPFHPPSAPPAWPAAPTGRPGKDLLAVPAAILISLAGMTILAVIASIPRQLATLEGTDLKSPQGVGYMVGLIVGVVCIGGANAVTILGSICMIRRIHYSLAWLAAIVSVIPLCSGCYVLGIPFGIWAMVLLSRENVKRTFL